MQGWLDWPDDDGATYEGQWHADTRLICEECNDYLEHPSYCEMCFDTMKQAALEGMRQPGAPERSVVYAIGHVVRYAEACAAKDEYISDVLSRALEAAHDWTRQRPAQQPAPSVPNGYVTLHEYELNRRIANAFDMGVEVDRQRVNEVRERLGIKPLPPTASVPNGVRETIRSALLRYEYMHDKFLEPAMTARAQAALTWLNEQGEG